MPDRTVGLRAAVQHAEAFLATVDHRPVAARSDATAVRDALGGPLPEHGEDPGDVVEALAAGAEPGLVATAGPRYFGFVIGGALPAALAADWLGRRGTRTPPSSLSPGRRRRRGDPAALALELLGLPADARRLRHRRADGELHLPRRRAARRARARGLGRRARRAGRRARASASSCGEQAHVPRSTGAAAARARPATRDPRRRRRPGPHATPTRSRRRSPRLDGPTIVCAQAGNVNTGAFDPFAADRRRRARRRRLAARRRRVRAVGRRRARARAHLVARRRARRLVGRPTPTSGSTCPTTAALAFVADPRCPRAPR